MPSSRTISLFLHAPAPGVASPSLPTCFFRSFSSQHGTTHRRPQPQRQHRAQFSPRSQPSIASFSSSSARRRDQNYYEVLDLPPTATAAEIKKQFYALSLRHHPDRNRSDPNASQRFARISAAYNTLGNANKRATYDRDHGFHLQHRTPPAGSHSSYNANLHKGYAGSRPPSGLSKRRGTFHGPPPSFYEQGGYGSTGRTETGSWTAGADFANAASSGGGSSKRRDPEDYEGFIDRNPLGHFNARGHFRTQKAEDMRRRERYARARQASLKEDGARDTSSKGEIRILRLVVVSGILVVTGLLGGFVHGVMPTGPAATAQDQAKARVKIAAVAAERTRKKEAQARENGNAAHGQSQTMSS
ncbi:hypothetical protein N7448_001046 [Penicillium atrosanguineum]|uniref:Uncharacterized protein n=1 Tax=Penicillium atrosanguineum TaxID=1132637 RepID=A0A9W9U801_9EURO|nr:uncharacterized protein N7443_004442 [Penicillium atrosanguineum]KAJ5133934.1 hypothetical protein N7526_005299 [Penicillium atrosanguineum]KAJ5149468.1 hypothetical protein N7448_001046 [Penicillium atrosanguineum]KAJ5304782.1 hypothetical protein N7443_004442 [Penicillium atrosanguineum]KAJ5324245.1 hypothetical protein N7476_002845 [Penicillium atrosanguineum]